MARTVNIDGEVIKPASFAYQDNMTLSDLIFKAGGFSENADLSVVEVIRRLSYEEASQVTSKLNKIFQFVLQRDLKLSPADAQFKLAPFDQVYVRKAPGAPSRAGGLVPEAYLEGATLTRTIKLSPAEIEAKRALVKKDTSLIFDFAADTESSLVGIDLVKINANPGSPAPKSSSPRNLKRKTMS